MRLESPHEICTPPSDRHRHRHKTQTHMHKLRHKEACVHASGTRPTQHHTFSRRKPLPLRGKVVRRIAVTLAPYARGPTPGRFTAPPVLADRLPLQPSALPNFRSSHPPLPGRRPPFWFFARSALKTHTNICSCQSVQNDVEAVHKMTAAAVARCVTEGGR